MCVWGGGGVCHIKVEMYKYIVKCQIVPLLWLISNDVQSYVYLFTYLFQ